MNWSDWTFRCSDGTEYAIDAEGNVLLPEGRKIAKGESFTVGPRNAPNVVRIPNGVALNPARRRHSAAADFVSMRVDAPEWFDETMRRDNERFNTGWTRYSVENDEIKVEHIDPRTVYYESGNNPWNTEGDRRFQVVKNLGNDWYRVVMQSSGGSHVPFNFDELIEMITPPYVRYRDPQTRLTPVAVAVKIALDGSVN